jgi:hypothetical protein
MVSFIEKCKNQEYDNFYVGKANGIDYLIACDVAVDDNLIGELLHGIKDYANSLQFDKW